MLGRILGAIRQLELRGLIALTGTAGTAASPPWLRIHHLTHKSTYSDQNRSLKAVLHFLESEEMA